MIFRPRLTSRIGKFLATFAATFLAAGIGSYFTTAQIASWYNTLIKPDLAPPNSWFGPVWTTLYILMALAAYLVWIKPRSQRAVRLYFAHLVVNALWSIVFFNFHAIGAALIVIALLWVMIVGMIVLFYRHNKPAAAMLIPYLLWVSFASYLNFSLWQLN